MRSGWSRPRAFVMGPLLCSVTLALGACQPETGGGYEPVTFRENEHIALTSNPDPPPVTAAPVGAGGAEIDFAAVSFPSGITEAMAQEGQQLYGTVCAACHGPGGGGTPAAPALNDAEWLNLSGAYDEIVNVIHTGVMNPVEYPGVMPALGGGNFDDEQVRAIAAYVFALSQQSGA